MKSKTITIIHLLSTNLLPTFPVYPFPITLQVPCNFFRWACFRKIISNKLFPPSKSQPINIKWEFPHASIKKIFQINRFFPLFAVKNNLISNNKTFAHSLDSIFSTFLSLQKVRRFYTTLQCFHRSRSINSFKVFPRPFSVNVYIFSLWTRWRFLHKRLLLSSFAFVINNG